MTEERTTSLRERMIEDMRIRGPGGQIPAGAHSGDQGFRRVSGALARYGDYRRASLIPASHDGYRGYALSLQRPHYRAQVLFLDNLRAG